MEIIGKLDEKKDAVKRTETFTVREFVLECQSNNSQYTDYILFQVTNERCALLDAFNVGDVLSVTFDIRGRKWTGQDGTQRVFNTLSAWRIEKYDPARNGQFAQGGYMQQPQGGFQMPQQPQYQPPMGNGGYAQPQQPAQPAQAPVQQPAAAPSADGDLPF
ncbi:MAG: DUF3127 domain-containing protein [Bacteroidales bacterium]|nr:DUF3127 domain-containing protein [Bacteroidales bacterium]